MPHKYRSHSQKQTDYVDCRLRLFAYIYSLYMRILTFSTKIYLSFWNVNNICCDWLGGLQHQNNINYSDNHIEIESIKLVKRMKLNQIYSSQTDLTLNHLCWQHVLMNRLMFRFKTLQQVHGWRTFYCYFCRPFCCPLENMDFCHFNKNSVFIFSRLKYVSRYFIIIFIILRYFKSRWENDENICCKFMVL